MKLSLLVVLFMSVLFMGCSKDKEESKLKEVETVVKKTEMIKLVEDTPKVQVRKVEPTKKSVVKNTKIAAKKKETVLYVDDSTKLVWQDDSIKDKLKSWNDASAYCKSLKLGEFNDWRLPDFDELLNIVEYKNYNPAIKSGFKKVVPTLYWSMSQNISDSSKAWSIHFKDGTTKYSNKSSLHYVCCVREKRQH